LNTISFSGYPSVVYYAEAAHNIKEHKIKARNQTKIKT